MLGRLIATAASTMMARQVGGAAAGPAGTAIGIALPFVLRRMGPAGMVAVAVGAWAVNRIVKMQAARDTEASGATIDVKAR